MILNVYACTANKECDLYTLTSSALHSVFSAQITTYPAETHKRMGMILSVYPALNAMQTRRTGGREKKFPVCWTPSNLRLEPRRARSDRLQVLMCCSWSPQLSRPHSIFQSRDYSRFLMGHRLHIPWVRKGQQASKSHCSLESAWRWQKVLDAYIFTATHFSHQAVAGRRARWWSAFRAQQLHWQVWTLRSTKVLFWGGTVGCNLGSEIELELREL